DHLKTVLDAAQEPVRIRKIVLSLGRDVTSLLQRMQRSDGRGNAQARIAAAEDQLLRLREEFDFANAAAAEFDVVPRHCDAPVPRVAVYLVFDRVDVLDGGVVEIFPPYERFHALEKRAARLPVPGALACLDPGGAFPVLPHAFVIKLGNRGRDGNL